MQPMIITKAFQLRGKFYPLSTKMLEQSFILALGSPLPVPWGKFFRNILGNSKHESWQGELFPWGRRVTISKQSPKGNLISCCDVITLTDMGRIVVRPASTSAKGLISKTAGLTYL
jgi:hypothetical protein